MAHITCYHLPKPRQPSPTISSSPPFPDPHVPTPNIAGLEHKKHLSGWHNYHYKCLIHFTMWQVIFLLVHYSLTTIGEFLLIQNGTFSLPISLITSAKLFMEVMLKFCETVTKLSAEILAWWVIISKQFGNRTPFARIPATPEEEWGISQQLFTISRKWNNMC